MVSFMPSEFSNLSTLARSKLHSSVGSKGDCNLHRWVLLKNSIVRSQPLIANTATSDNADVNNTYALDDDDYDVGTEEEDSFMFPDAGKLVGNTAVNVDASEAQWLDSLLETLGDDETNLDSDVHASISPADDEETLLSPLVSPMSSSDDLLNQLDCYPPPASVSYPVSYSPLHPPLSPSYEFDSSSDISDSPDPLPYADPFPYHHLDDIENLSVPDAIEDTSDDESDAPPTPSLGRSTSSLSLVDPASIPLPGECSRQRLPVVFIDTADPYFYPFKLDPLPFPDDRRSSDAGHEEC